MKCGRDRTTSAPQRSTSSRLWTRACDGWVWTMWTFSTRTVLGPRFQWRRQCRPWPQLVKQGKTLHVGISSYSPERTRRAYELLKSEGVHMLIHQPSYSMLNRHIENGLLDVLGDLGVGCIGFSALAQGLLTNKYIRGSASAGRALEGESFRKDFLSEENLKNVRGLAAIAKKRGQTLAQMAIDWVLRDERVTSALIGVGNLELANRIVIAPMCQYSAVNGCMTDWHLVHLGQLVLSGAALLTIEATAVLPEGRITYGDVGLWNDETEAAMRRVLEGIRKCFDMPIGIQLNHAGRKASTDVPWDGGAQFPPEDARGWQTVGPSAIPFEEKELPPTALTRDEIGRIREAFVAAARRADRLGIQLIQIHVAHGYLLHQFLSPLSNKRDDEYGGSLKNRMRFPLEVFDAVRGAFAAEKPVSVRLSATDWVDGGWDLEQSIVFAKGLEDHGCSAIHISSGGLHTAQIIPVGPSYQVPLARAVKESVNMPVIAVGLITAFEQAEAIVGTGDADMIALARTVLYDPRWPWHAAAELGAHIRAPKQYLRSQPRRLKDLFATAPQDGDECD